MCEASYKLIWHKICLEPKGSFLKTLIKTIRNLKMEKYIAKKLVLSAITGSILVASQMASAHTRLQIPAVDEGTRVYNNEVISHGCRNPETQAVDLTTIATVLVFPDGIDSSITVNGEVSDQPLNAYIDNWGSPIRKIQNKDLFELEKEIKDPLGNVLGYWAGVGGRQGSLIGMVPFRTNSFVVTEASCAKSVKVIIAIADICKLTSVSDFNDADVMLWTPAVGSQFDGTEDLNGYNSPASLMINRTSALPDSCGAGVDVVVTPSAAQLNRDMTVEIEGTQVWPLADGHSHSDDDHADDDTSGDHDSSSDETAEHTHP